MPTYTTTYSLGKPVVGADEDAWGDTLNTSLDAIDDILDGTTPVTGIDINSGTLDGVTIGGTTAGAGTFTTLTATTSITGTLATAAQPNITSVGSLTSLDVGGTVTADGLTVDGSSVVATFGNTASNNYAQIKRITSNVSTLTLGTSSNLAQITGGPALSLSTGAADGTSEVRRMLISSGGDISFYEDTGTTAKFFWDASAESLGIGTTSPAFPLDVSTNSSTTNDAVVVARLSANTTGTAANNFGAALNFSGEDASGSLRDLATINGIYTNATNRSSALTFKTRENLGALTERMRIDSSGNVGIGITPVVKLDVQSSSGIIGRIQSTSGDAQFNIAVPNVNDGILAFGDASAYRASIKANTSDALTFQTGSSLTERMRIDSSGNVGIGTSSPAGTLQLKDAAAKIQLTNDTNTGSAEMAFRTTAGSNRGFVAYNFDSDYMNFRTGGSGEAMRIDSSGNVGIGTSSPSDNLDVASAAPTLRLTDTDGFYSQIYAGSGSLVFRTDVGQATTGDTMQFVLSGSEAMRIDSSGNLLVGHTTVDSFTNVGHQLDADGYAIHTRTSAPSLYVGRKTTDGSIMEFNKDGTTVGSISVTGSSTAYNTSSDHRLKENVVELTGATDLLKQLEPKRFNFIADADTTVDGFLAHEVQTVVPEAITGTKDEVDADGNPVYQGIDQSKLVPLLVATIKELEARITALEAN